MYNTHEVEAVILEYDAFKSVLEDKGPVGAEWIAVRKADIDVGMTKLDLPERRVLFLCGILGWSTRDAGDKLDMDSKQVWRHYRRGIKNLTSILNGGVNA